MESGLDTGSSKRVDLRFAFGANWQDFVATSVSEETVGAAVRSLQRLLDCETLEGRTFLDIGCGSGLFSLAACALGAESVVSFDYDPLSVAAATTLRDRAGVSPDRWRIEVGSILDQAYVQRLPRSDIVYSWGVLHHTGEMWRAIDNAVGLVKPGGLLVLAIYNNVERRLGGSRMWWHIKRLYNRAPPAVRRAMEYAFLLQLVARHLGGLRDPRTFMRMNRGRRGMSLRHNIRDWLGGYPYEYATAGTVFNHMRRQHGLELAYLNTHDGIGCNEFTFRASARPSA